MDGRQIQPPRPAKKVRKFELKFHLNPRKLLLWLVIFLLFAPFLLSLWAATSLEEEVPLTQALNDIRERKISEVEVEGEQLHLTYTDGEKRLTRKEGTETFIEILKASEIDPQAVSISVLDQSLGRVWWEIAGTVLPLVLMALFFLFLIRQARGAQDSLFSFGRSRAKLFSKGKQTVTFADVGGVAEAKKEMEEIVDFLKHPRKYSRLGARTPKGALLVGPSGTGKTLLARAIAGEAGVPFFSMAGSEFMEMLVGVGASVTGDTPILTRKDGEVYLEEIGTFVDQYYQQGKEGFVVNVEGAETLGLLSRVNGFWGSRSLKRPVFGGSVWQRVEAVYRHKAEEIYEIAFLGGMIRTTGDHSVFVREQGGIRAKEVRSLQKGNVLVNLPMNTRAWDDKRKQTLHRIKKHKFGGNANQPVLDIWQDDTVEIEKHEYALTQQGVMSQYAIAEEIGVSQATVGHWQRGIHVPQKLSKKAVKLDLPKKVIVTPALCRLMGYYTAEGRGTNNLEFTFGVSESGYIEDVVELMEKVFGLDEPVLEWTETNTIKVKYYSAHLGRFFASYCGNGSHNKHIPAFLWELPFEYFLAYLEGYSNGDGYTTKAGKLSCTSVSQRLIRELAWLCCMHGIKVGIKHEIQRAGRVIGGKPLPETESWRLIVGKTSNPFGQKSNRQYQFKRCIVQSVTKKPFDGYVYDLCGVESEAFFGGETPLLLHNSRVRDLFDTAKKAAPSIIFIDEIDAIGRIRGLGVAGGHDEREQTLNQILVEMDGFTPNDNVIVVAATNRGDLLDPALLRPGRFDRRITLDLPDIEERTKILKIHAKGKPMNRGIDWERVAKRTVGFSGADLENMLNEAAILAARTDKNEVDMEDIEEAATKVKLGPEKKRLQSDLERKMTAYHEAGHAVVGHLLPYTDPVHRVSIVSRGLALGFTLMPPEKDKYTQTRSELLDKIVALLGGRAAEELVFAEFTGGAASDIDQVTRIARHMVIDYGMSDLGPINLGPQWDTTSWGRPIIEPSQVSNEMQAKVDAEIKRIVDRAYSNATSLLAKHREKLDAVVERLLVKESVDGEEFEKIMGVAKKKPPDG